MYGPARPMSFTHKLVRKSLVREKLGFSVLTVLEIRVADVNTFGIPLSVTLQGTHESFIYVEQRLC